MNASQTEQSETRKPFLIKQIHLKEQLRTSLRNVGFLRNADIRISLDEGVVVLNGMVDSFYLKQLAQTVILSQPEVIEVRNQLIVNDRQHLCHLQRTRSPMSSLASS